MTGRGDDGVIRGEQVEQLIDSMANAKKCPNVDELKIPFRCVASDFRSASEVVIKNGRLSMAVRASMSIPGIFKPVLLDGKILFDGGMLNNLPVDVVKAMGADIVIAIDLQQEEKKAPKRSADLGILEGLGDLLGIGGLLKWVTTRPDITKYADNIKQSTIYIHPPLPDMDASSFGNKNSARMIKVGEEEAMKHWDELLQLKERLNND